MSTNPQQFSSRTPSAMASRTFSQSENVVESQDRDAQLYFFAIRGYDGASPENHIRVLESLDHARGYALRTISGLVFDALLKGREHVDLTIDIENELGDRLDSVAVRTSVKFAPGSRA